MILHGNKKKVIKQIVKYYMDTTNNTYDKFVQNLLALQCGKLDLSLYENWLLSKLHVMLTEHEISIADCVENKDTLQTILAAGKSRKEGEFYTPEIWCVDGREYLKAMLGDLWGKAYVWDGSAGTGGLMRTSNYPQDKLFLSSLLQEDVEIMQAQFPNATVFQCDFVNGLDIDAYNMDFSLKLPENLRSVLQNNEPIVFYMNPPYKVGIGASTDVGMLMQSQGMGKCGADILYQFIYRICLLKRIYRLTDVYIGLFGGLTLFHSHMLEPMLKELLSDFVFVDGMCFQAKDFANTSDSVQWAITYTTWRTRKPEDGQISPPIKLATKQIDDIDQNTIKITGERTFAPVAIPLHDWVRDRSILSYTYAPTFSSASSSKNMLGRCASESTPGFLGIQLMADNYAIRGTRRCCIMNGAAPDGIDVLKSNFWRATASLVARSCYKRIINPFDNCQYYSKPNTDHPDYTSWIQNALVYMIFEYSNCVQAFRDFEDCDSIWNFNNSLFPLSMAEVKSIAVDAEVQQDIVDYPNDNSFILDLIEQSKVYWYPETQELYDWGIAQLKTSLTSGRRKIINFKNSLNAWDASLMQLRRTSSMWSEALELELQEKLTPLRKLLESGIYKFGFLQHYAGEYVAVQEQEISDELLEIMESEEEI